MPKNQQKSVQEPINSARKMILKTWPKFDEFTTEQQLEFATNLFPTWERTLNLLNSYPKSILTKQQKKQKGELPKSIAAVPELIAEIKTKLSQEQAEEARRIKQAKEQLVQEQTEEARRIKQAKEWKIKELKRAEEQLAEEKQQRALELVQGRRILTKEEKIWIISGISLEALNKREYEINKKIKQIFSSSDSLNEKNKKDLEYLLTMIRTSLSVSKNHYVELLNNQDLIKLIDEEGITAFKKATLVLPEEESIEYLTCANKFQKEEYEELAKIKGKNYQKPDEETMFNQDLSAFSEVIETLNKILTVNDKGFLKMINTFTINLQRVTDYVFLRLNELPVLKQQEIPIQHETVQTRKFPQLLNTRLITPSDSFEAPLPPITMLNEPKKTDINASSDHEEASCSAQF